MKNIMQVLIISIILIILTISAVSADDRNITSLNGESYFDASSSVDGYGTVDNPYKNLNNDRLSDSVLHFKNGVYTFTGNKYFYQDTTIIGESQENTILEYTGFKPYTVFNNNQHTLTLINITLKGVTIYNNGVLNCDNVLFKDCIGCSGIDKDYTIRGGAIICYSSSKIPSYDIGCNLNNCSFTNTTAAYGGGIYSENIPVNINNTKFIGCSALSYGGGIAVIKSNLTINNSYFKDDSSKQGSGGAIYANTYNPVLIANTDFDNCSAWIGGGVCIVSTYTYVVEPVSIYNTNFYNNKAKYDGGAIYRVYGVLSLNYTKFTNNTANNGGGIYMDALSSCNITETIFNENYALNKGAAIFKTSVDNFKLNNVLITGLSSIFEQLYYPPVKECGEFKILNGTTSFTGPIPSRYSLVDEGYVTPVKAQESSDNCWAFAPLAALESCILKSTNVTYDFSETNIKNLASYYSPFGCKVITNTGGYDGMALGYLTSWLGPVCESDDPYDIYNHLSPIIDSGIHVQNIYTIPPRSSPTDNDAVKLAILKYGAVSSQYYQRSSNFNYDTYGYYNKDETSTNHAIAIVGWDDNYSRYNFYRTPEGDGAFIIKNSWGSSWGDNGYFYISYYDASLLRIGVPADGFTFILNDTTKYNKNYQYDMAGVTDYYQMIDENIWYANVFNSTGNDNLAAFSTYFYNDLNYTAEIYVNNNLMLTQSGETTSGYYTIKLNKLIPLKTGDEFKISIKLTSPTGIVGFPISEYRGSVFSSVRSQYRSGATLYSYNGNTWNELGCPACLKAFTVPIEEDFSKKDLDMDMTVNQPHYGEKLTVNIELTEKINETLQITIDNKNYFINTINGKAFLEINEPITPDAYLLTVKFDGNDQYREKIITTNILILKQNININSNISNDGLNVIFNITARDVNQNLASGDVKIIISNQEQTITTNDGKVNTIFTDLYPDRYIYSITFLENSNYNKKLITGILTIDKLKTDFNIEIPNTTYKDPITVKIIANESLKQNITLSINENNYTIFIENKTTTFKIPIVLNAGNYTGTVVLKENELYYETNNNCSFEVKKQIPQLEITQKCNKTHTTIYIKTNTTGKVQATTTDKNYTIDLINGTGEFVIPSQYKYALISYLENENYQKITRNITLGSTVEKIEITANVTIGNNFAFITIKSQKAVNTTILFRMEGIEKNVTLSSGHGYVELGDLNPGNYLFDILCDDSKYEGYYNGEFEIAKLKTTLTGNDFKMYYQNGSYIVKLTKTTGDALKNMTIYFTINGQNYTRKTKEDGTASMPINLNVGQYLLIARFNGTDEYQSAETSNNVTILSNIYTNDLVKMFRNESQFIITLKDNNENPLIFSKIVMNINGVFYNRTTDNKGIAKLNINLGVGSYVITVKNLVTGEMKSNNITVLPILTENKNIVKYFKNETHYTIKVLDNQGKAISGAVVTFNINGIFYNRTTNSDGIAKLNLNLGPGTFIITAIYNGFMVSNNVTVKSTALTNNLNMKFQDGSAFKAQILNDNGNPEGQNKLVKFNVNGVIYSRNTDNNGLVSLTINLPKGKYIITTIYGELQQSNTIKIK